MKVCAKCGYQGEGKFCPTCGIELVEVEAAAEEVAAEAVVAEEVATEEVAAEAVAEEVAVEAVEEVAAEAVVEPVVEVAAPKKRKGKKIIAIVLAVLVVLVGAVALLGSSSPENMIVDDWQMTGLLKNGNYSSGTFSTAVFNKDKTGTITISGKDFNLTWEFQKESDALYVYKLTLSGGGTIFAGVSKPDDDSDKEVLIINVSDEYSSVYERK